MTTPPPGPGKAPEAAATVPDSAGAKPAAGKPAPKPSAVAATRASPSGGRPGSSRLGRNLLQSALLRAALGLAGLGLLVGFFMPWVGLGQVVTASGFGLMVGQGEVIQVLSGVARAVLLAVPVLGAILVFGAVTGHPASLWVALLSGMLVLGYGIVILITLFLQSTGLGLWVVVACAFLSLAAALFGIGGRRRT